MDPTQFGLAQGEGPGDDGQLGARNFGGPPGTQGWTNDAYMGKFHFELMFFQFKPH